MQARRSVAGAAVALVCAGLPFAAQPLAHLAWLALIAPALGVLAARALPFALGAVLSLAWMLPLTLAGRAAPPEPCWGWCVIAGLYGLGLACGALVREHRVDAAGALLLVTLLASTAPARGAWGGAPWPPALARALLDVSPTALALESAGVDWMRHASVYEPVGTDRFERSAWRGALAGPLLLLVGYLSAAAAHLLPRRLADRARRGGGGPGANPCASSSAPSRST